MKILLLCNEGMSTSLLVKKMQQEAEKQGIKDIEIMARSIIELESLIDHFDIVMLGPQIKYKEKMVSDLCGVHCKKYTVIPPMIYGMINGKKALELAIETFNN
ncbi:PTS sugar transporter subunit IIB [Abyssisolibacter fermentans]|uniref:PTS sugar transporter subunit IIB n=1 Tax=Abyssisolibacter fermentans TaxID=1766203 RepID=UPI00082D24D2|nr:PTS sugar transporter subunit IIB [Abyssisolibacter fermentans]